jgi:putative inorganic carbon (hco3(-)) transporter
VNSPLRAVAGRQDSGPWLPLIAVAGAGALTVILISGMDAPLVLLLALAALGAVWLVLTAPFTGVLMAIFLIFTNLPAVAHRQGLLPEAAAAALVGLLFVPALVRNMAARRERLLMGPVFGLMVAFLAVKLISSAFAVDVPLALGHTGAYAMEGMVVFLLVVNTVRNRSDLVRALAVIVGAAAFLSALTIYQTISGNLEQEFGGLAQRSLEHLEGRSDAIRTHGSLLEDRSRGPVDDANRYGQILLVAGAFALALFWNATGRLRAVLLGAGALVLSAILLTYSRGAFLTLVLLIVALGALRYLPPRRLAVVLLVGALMVPVVAPGYMDRVHSIAGAIGLVSPEATTVEPDGPTRGRTTQMLAATLAFAEHPVLGVGPGQYTPHHSVRYQLRPEIAFRALPVPRRAHNLFLEVAAEGGVVGLLLFLAIPFFLLRSLWRIRRTAMEERLGHVEHLAVGFLLAILAYLGTGMFLHLAFQRYYWMLVALSAAAIWILTRELDWVSESRLEPGT